jgi:hypothetical protein
MVLNDDNKGTNIPNKKEAIDSKIDEEVSKIPKEQPASIELKTDSEQEFEQEQENPSFSFQHRNKDYDDPFDEDYKTIRDNQIDNHEKRESGFWFNHMK